MPLPDFLKQIKAQIESVPFVFRNVKGFRKIGK